MSRAKITNGIWSRNVPWEKDGLWRTDIFKSVLADPRLQTARYVLKDGRQVLVSVAELRRVLVGGADHYEGGKIWGPFNIDPLGKTINDHSVAMEVI